MLIRVTIAVPDAALRSRLKATLARPDVLVQMPRARVDLWERLTHKPADVLIVSQAVLPKHIKPSVLQQQNNSPALVVIADNDDPVAIAKLTSLGFDATLAYSQAVEQVREVIQQVLAKRRRLSERGYFRQQPLGEPRLADFASVAPGMAEFMNVVPRVVPTDSTLLIEGETGVGKERLACAIHAEGPRSTNRFVALNCGALPEHLLESELFGHVRGAFTGATNNRRGWFEVAHQGTLFLDEVSEIPLHLQVKLLRVLQEQVIQPVGSEKTLKIDVRVVAASNRPLQQEVEAKRFRQDLFYRLSVVTVTVPPLRERSEDIPMLVTRQMAYLAAQLGRPTVGVHPHALQALCRHAWPGNLRELNNILERALLLCDDMEITLDDLPDTFTRVVAEQLAEIKASPPPRRVGAEAPAHLPAKTPPPLQLPTHWLAKSLQELRQSVLSDLERQYIEGLLVMTRGRIGEAAKRAGLSGRSLYEKMQQFGFHKEDFRQPAVKEYATHERRNTERRNTDRRARATAPASSSRRRA